MHMHTIKHTSLGFDCWKDFSGLVGAKSVVEKKINFQLLTSIK